MTDQSDSWPDGFEFIRQAREALGLFSGAMPITPQQAWEEALDRMRLLEEFVLHDIEARNPGIDMDEIRRIRRHV